MRTSQEKSSGCAKRWAESSASCAPSACLRRAPTGAPERALAEPTPRTLTGLDRAVDVMVEMKNASEVCVGLAYSAVLLRDKGLAAEVAAIEDGTDEMHHELERWTLRAALEG